MTFDISKQDPKLITLLMDSCVNGISLADVKAPDMPLVYVNEAFERMTGVQKGRHFRQELPIPSRTTETRNA
jgi:hypothetical protein